MSTVWFTADTHFGHEGIIRHCNRPFSTVEEMDEALIEKWNSVVTKRDTVYHLGDVGLGRDTHTLNCVSRLNGRKILIWGNHDSVHPRHRKAMARQQTWARFFVAQSMMAQVRIGGKDVLLSHFPYAGDHSDNDRFTQWRPRNEGTFLLHGHVHTEWILNEGMINVGVDVHGYRPISLDEVSELITWNENMIAALDVAEQDKTIEAPWLERAVASEYEYERTRREGS